MVSKSLFSCCCRQWTSFSTFSPFVLLSFLAFLCFGSFFPSCHLSFSSLLGGFYVFSGIHGYPGWKSRTEGIFHGCPRHRIIFIINFVKSCLKRFHWIQSQNPSRSPVILQSPPERGISPLDLFQCSISIRDWDNLDNTLTGLVTKETNMSQQSFHIFYFKRHKDGWGYIFYCSFDVLGKICHTIWTQQCWPSNFLLFNPFF